MGEKDFANLLHQLRRSAELTQEELARRAGYSISHLRKLEQGSRKPSVEAAATLARALQLSAADEAALRAASDGEQGKSTDQKDVAPFEGRPRVPGFLERVLAVAHERLPIPRAWLVAILTLLGVLISMVSVLTILVAALVIRDLTTSPRIVASALVIPGGEWISPMSGYHAVGSIRFAALAYPSNPNDPKIAYVNFTASWEGRPGPWIIACKVTKPSHGNEYQCVWHPKHVPSGKLNVSFDVYDINGNHNNSPNGVHIIHYTARY